MFPARPARGMQVIICGAGGAAHLAGVTAAFTTLPVIGVPILGKSTTALIRCCRWCRCRRACRWRRSPSTARRNAGILAAQILAMGDARLQEELKKFKVKLTEESRAKNKTLAQ